MPRKPNAAPRNSQLESGRRQVSQRELAAVHRWISDRKLQRAPKLNINVPGDKLEEEADQVANRTMTGVDVKGMNIGRTQLSSIAGVAQDSGSSSLQRFCADCENEQARTEPSNEVADQIQRLRDSPGKPLPESERRFFESRIDHDFSNIRIHANRDAEAAADALNAKAFTVGRDIVFGRDQYRPGTHGGRRLLAHELTHTIQQGSAAKIQREPRNEDRPGESAVPQGVIGAMDANVRLNQYVAPAQQLADQIFKDMTSGRIDHMTARVRAAERRNQLLRDTRTRLSPGGRMLSIRMKEEGKTLEALERRYALKELWENRALRQSLGIDTLDADSPRFNEQRVEQALARLRPQQRTRAILTVEQLKAESGVSRQIVFAAGRTNPVFTGVARFSRIAGPIGAGVGVATSAYEVYSAPEGEQLYYSGREAAGFVGGTLGGIGGAAAGTMAGAWSASLLCGPGAPVCAVVVTIGVTITGATVGGYGGAESSKAGYEQFLDWLNRTNGVQYLRRMASDPAFAYWVLTGSGN